MKRINSSLLAIAMAVATVFAVGCTGTTGNGKANDAECRFLNVTQERMVKCDSSENDGPQYVHNTFSVVWPTMLNGNACDTLQRALLDALTTTADEEQKPPTLNSLDELMEHQLTRNLPQGTTAVDSIPEDAGMVYSLNTTLRLKDLDKHVATFVYVLEEYVGGAHSGVYKDYVTYDINSGRVLDLYKDLIADTTLFRKQVVQSLKDNPDVEYGNLFINSDDTLPLPTGYYLEDYVLHVIYQPYHIASWAQGLIDTPIYVYVMDDTDMNHMLTPLARQLLLPQ